MPTDAVELLDRQFERLDRQEGPEYVRELKAFHDFLTSSGPREIVDSLAELRVDAERIEQEFSEHDIALIPQVVALKERLVRDVPETDDSSEPRPQRIGGPPMEWAYTLANFDQLADGGPDRLVVRQGYDQSVSSMLIGILDQRLRRLQFCADPGDPTAPWSDDNLRPELDGLRRDLRNLAEVHRHAANIFTNAIETHGGIQIQVLDAAVEAMNPAPVVVSSDDDEHAQMNRIFRSVMSGMYAVEDAAAGRQLTSTAAQSLDFTVGRLKPAAEKVYEAVRLKIAVAPATAPDATPDYGERLKAWVLSPGYALLGSPCIGGAITQLVQDEGKDAVLFVVLAVLAAGLPPLRGALPRLSYSRVSLAFIVLTTAAFVIALVTSGLGLAFLAFMLMVVSFSAGAYTARRSGDQA